MNTHVCRLVFVLILLPVILTAQAQHDTVPVKHWSAPLFWQPGQDETVNAIVGDATTPANALVFVGMTPCRVVDTRSNSGFTGAFGPPNLIAAGSRTFPIRSSATCLIPSIAQAYSFNITIVPAGFLNYLTVWPTGQPRPNASTLNGYVNTVIANAAIVPAGTNGSVDVFASENTDLIIDINGYYAPQTGMTLAQGNAAAPSLSFSGDAGTGIFSSGPGIVNVASGGNNRLQVSNDSVGIATTNALVPSVQVVTPGEGIRIRGQGTGSTNLAWLSFYDSAGTPMGFVGDAASGDTSTYLASYTQNVYLSTPVGAVLTAHQNGNVGIGTTTPQSRLDVRGDIALGPNGQLRAASGEENLRIIRGTIRGDGVILAGSGFTVDHPAVGGGYTINFNTPFAAVPSVTVTLAGCFCFILARAAPLASASFAQVEIADRDYNRVDFPFHFVAIGPR
jgi:hypothetical protein